MTAEHDAEREQKKANAVEAVEAALSEIESRGREPDPWERTFLVQAINSVFGASVVWQLSTPTLR